MEILKEWFLEGSLDERFYYCIGVDGNRHYFMDTNLCTETFEICFVINRYNTVSIIIPKGYKLKRNTKSEVLRIASNLFNCGNL